MKSKFLKHMSHKMLPFLISFVQKIIYLTCRKKYIMPSQMPYPAIWVVWHSHLLMSPYIYLKIKSSKRKMNVIVSRHTHGDIAISAAKSFGMDYIRGSTRKGAIKALIQAMRALKNGEDVALTPDGPKGPLHSVSDGAVILSSKCNVAIVALGWSATSFWQLNSWDKAKIPKPFSTITFKVSEPFKLDGLANKEAKEKIKKELMWCLQE